MPPSEFYRLGEKEGRSRAVHLTSSIKNCQDTADLARLAGRSLVVFQEKSHEFYAREEKFSLGYWEGFMARAEEIRAE